MKATGLVRRIDDMGRIVIPKEIRKALQLQKSELLEIFADRRGEIILRKYSLVAEIANMAERYAGSLAKAIDGTVCITDSDQVIGAAGEGAGELEQKYISRLLASYLQEQKQVTNILPRQRIIPVTEHMKEYGEELITLIQEGGDVLGSVILLNPRQEPCFGEREKAVAFVSADFLGRQMKV